MTKRIEENFLQTIKRVFNHNTSLGNISSSLIKVALPDTKSKIIQNNTNYIYCSKFKNIEGLFIKEQNDTRLFGRYLCDLTKEKLNCSGFFTSDELPRYGINRANMNEIFASVDKQKGDGDLVILYAYEEKRAIEINNFVKNFLNDSIRKIYP